MRLYLECGCVRSWVENGRVTMHTIDGIGGTEYFCPIHHEWVKETEIPKQDAI